MTDKTTERLVPDKPEIARELETLIHLIGSREWKLIEQDIGHWSWVLTHARCELKFPH